MLSDPGFEQRGAEQKAVVGRWYRNYGDAQSRWERTDSDAHSGRWSMMLVAQTVPEHNPSVTIEQAAAVIPGREYVLRVWTRCDQAGRQGLLAIVWQGPHGEWITHSGTEFRYSDQWVMQRLVATAPPGAAYGVARIDLREPGSAWVDDAFLGILRADRLEPGVTGGKVLAGARLTATVCAVDADGLPVEGETIRASVTGSGAYVRPKAVQTDERGMASFVVQAPKRPGSAARVSYSVGAISTDVRLTADAHGEPAAYAISPSISVASPPHVVHVKMALVGRFGERLPIPSRRLRVTVMGGTGPSTVVTDRNGMATVAVQLAGGMCSRALIRVVDAQGIAGAAGPYIVAQMTRDDRPRFAGRRYLMERGGAPFVPLGGLYANWPHRVVDGHDAGGLSQSLANVSDEDLQRWYAFLRDQGVTALRGMLRDHAAEGTEPMDIVGRANPRLLARWEHVMALARPYGIRFLLTLHESWYATYAAYFNRSALEKCVLPRYAPGEMNTLPAYRRRFLVEKRMLTDTREPMTDPDVLACQRDYLLDLIPRLRSNPDVFGYEIENEQPNGFFDWTRSQVELVRALDPKTPICVSHLGGGLFSADPLVWMRRVPMDFYTFHIYPSGDMTSPQIDYGLAVALTARYVRSGKLPAMSGEAFGDEWFQATPAARSLGARDCVWAQLTGGMMGAFFWNTGDEATREFRLAKAVSVATGLGRRKPAMPQVRVSVPQSADDRRFQSADGKALYGRMAKATRDCALRGVDFELTTDASGVRLEDAASAVARVRPTVAPSTGYEAYTLRFADGGALCYLRNVAGIVPIQANSSQGWTRSRAISHAGGRMTVSSAVRVTDLDTGRQWTVHVKVGGSLNLGDTDHDFALVIEPAGRGLRGRL